MASVGSGGAMIVPTRQPGHAERLGATPRTVIGPVATSPRRLAMRDVRTPS